ncbi:hypothetical protein [Pedobacter steynii]|uniref:TonB C-terminal domain-containing protein n=1 Tax=Pedobacter steynii TaxID=430522 RepID=A0A1D7QMW1_9SPHI|nr:hypothetical protein [Pedobacter steynii]AOM80002.1 hypothetical protein BFS30_24280 [Pedobacter steynii]
MKKIYFLSLILFLFAAKSFGQAAKPDILYYNEEAVPVAEKDATIRITKKTSNDGSYTLDKYDLKGRKMMALEIYGTEGLPVGTWKVYDTKQQKIRTFSYDTAIKYQALVKENEKSAGAPTIYAEAPPSMGNPSEAEPGLSEPVLKPGKYKNFSEYYIREFYLNEAVAAYLSDAQSLGVRAVITIDPVGKVTDVKFRRDPVGPLKREMIRVFLNSPELQPMIKNGKPVETKAVFTFQLRTN